MTDTGQFCDLRSNSSFSLLFFTKRTRLQLQNLKEKAFWSSTPSGEGALELNPSGEGALELHPLRRRRSGAPPPQEKAFWSSTPSGEGALELHPLRRRRSGAPPPQEPLLWSCIMVKLRRRRSSAPRPALSWSCCSSGGGFCRRCWVGSHHAGLLS
ncbi:hypothetical protein WMY93_001909 [Mugilogobius chulae]|uniref:Uncharacterized protein n=1 Tax=Mugilogobius chulae TaxID=88201 RepID=A0AAW0PS17_9GOBI